MASFLDNVFDMFKNGGINKRKTRNNTASNSNLTNIKDTNVAMGEDSGALEDFEDGELK